MRKLKLREGKSHAQATQLLVCMISQPSTLPLRMGSLLHTIKTPSGLEILRSLGPRTPGRGALAPKRLDPTLGDTGLGATSAGPSLGLCQPLVVQSNYTA